jgi:metallo-beta-lactamase family protein
VVSAIAKKKLIGDGIYFVGMNSSDVTGSCIVIKYSGKQILLEIGLFQSNGILEGYKINTEKFKFNPKEIDYCFINHQHLDHQGLLPRLIKEGFKGKVITCHSVASFFEPMLLNSSFIMDSEARMLTKKFKRDYSPIYIEDDVYHALDFVYEFDDYDKIYKLDDVVSFRWYRNSHCIGAKQLQLILNGVDGKTSILYTSDIGSTNSKNHYVDNTEICKEFNKISIMESTYGEKSRINKKTRDFDIEHLRVAINTVMERKGKVLLPAFSFSRTQELLTTIYELYHNDKSFNYDVIVDSKLSCDICDLYGEVLTGDALKLWNKVYNWKNVKFISEKSDSILCVKDDKPKIVISSSGFCTNGRVVSYLQEYLKDEKNMIVFSGYVGGDSSYLSYRIKNFKDNKTLTINKKPIPNRADCITLSTFSSHASHDELVEIGSELNTEKIILVHGSEAAKNNLQKDIQEAISKKNKTSRVICSTKDMVVHL